MNPLLVVCGLAGMMFLSACASSQYKMRQEQREKMASSSGLFCEWINGDKHSDLEVELNMQMAKRCDSSKPFSLTPYKNNSDQNGIMYCCGTASGNVSVAAPTRKASAKAATSSSPAANKADEEIVEDK